ncbi:MAG: 2-C-methyl-D-erythritol 4-phosphate cytidylyltransferase, partial [Planctomycetes bacterium]|nr:2-C-methyl-D-erythritol 4-phosphate cytidylyltransferase [Planctomycetota bacterium]
IAVIIPAAGFAKRYTDAGGLRHKIDEDLGGKVVLQRTVELFTKYEPEDAVIASIIVAGPHDEAALKEFRNHHADRLGLLGASICRGGATHRWETVKAALGEVPTDCTHVAIHDAVRPCTPDVVLDRVFRAARKHAAVIPAIEVTDTLKRVVEVEGVAEERDPLAAILGAAPKAGPRREVKETVPRTGLVAVQTPQVFEAALLREAYQQADLSSTDDAGLVERLWIAKGDPRRVLVVEGDARNLKITHPQDLTICRAILGVRGPDDRPTHKRF